MMFEKREVRFLTGTRRDVVWARAWDWWGRQGFRLTQTGPYRAHGSSRYARIGLRHEFDLILDEQGGGTNVDLSFHAQVTDEGLIAGAVTAVFLLPVAVLGGAVSYSEYESDARNLMIAFWRSIETSSADGPTPTPSEVPPPCKGCGAAMLPDWKVCPDCGLRRE
ncbi:MAG TPA: hypothetical protein VF992_03445 [Thermoplasmata archaeon]